MSVGRSSASPSSSHRWGRLRLALLLSSLLPSVLGGSGCQSKPYCLNCVGTTPDAAGTDGPIIDPGDLAGVDLTVIPDLFGTACVLSNGGVEICDGLDNDCNGTTDDVAASKLAGDPNNCGHCGTVCNFTAQKQFGACDQASGTPTCVPGACLPGFVNADGNAANGCEYACVVSNGGVEICDGKDNNCDNQIDEGFDTKTDPSNCGGCGVSCARPNTPGNCVAGACKVIDCASGFKNVDGNPTNGCEYACPVFPPVAESCNNIDDDCNGVTDNSPSGVGGACNQFCGTVAACVGTGTCTTPLSTCTSGCCGICTPGLTVCSGGSIACSAGMRPQLEVCDGADNNCDGRIDEGFDTQTDPLNCATCGHVCSLPHVLTHKCTTAICGIVHTGTPGTSAYQQSGCQPGYSDLNNSPVDGCEQQCEVYPTSVEVCDGKDNDCDGQIDEIGAGGITSAPSNACRQTSLCAGASPVCCGTAGWLCDYRSINSNIEIQEAAALSCKAVPGGATRLAGTLVFAETKCDGIDGDCKGGADDSFLQKGKPCTVGIGVCAGSSNFICNVAGTGVTCPATATPGNATAEECNGKDDNCDGQVDERVAVGGFLPGYIDRFVKVAPSLWIYAYEASRIDSTALSAGGSSTARACSKPAVLPWASVTRAEAAAACDAIVLGNGTTHARLCTTAEWQSACEGPGGAQVNSYSVSTANTVYAALVCNDSNRIAPPAVWATGHDNGQAKACYTDWAAAGKAYDLSANLMEWTSTSLTLAGKTYYKVRGGAYTSPSDGTPPDGTSCEFDFNILPEGFLNSDVGFRCCADVAP